MAVLTKQVMIENLVNSGKAQDLKKEKESQLSFAKRLYSMTETEIQKLYEERIGNEPEKAIDAVIEEVKKASKKAKKEAKIEEVAAEPKAKKSSKKSKAKAEPIVEETPVKSEKEQSMYKEGKDRAGNVYAKAWIPELLDKAGFSELKYCERHLKLRNVVEIKGAEPSAYDLIYDMDKNTLSAKKFPQGRIVNTTPMFCEFIVRKFINKYSGLDLQAPEV